MHAQRGAGRRTRARRGRLLRFARRSSDGGARRAGPRAEHPRSWTSAGRGVRDGRPGMLLGQLVGRSVRATHLLSASLWTRRALRGIDGFHWIDANGVVAMWTPLPRREQQSMQMHGFSLFVGSEAGPRVRGDADGFALPLACPRGLGVGLEPAPVDLRGAPR